ncbi:NAN1_1 [Sanghuangporus vaninii]
MSSAGSSNCEDLASRVRAKAKEKGKGNATGSRKATLVSARGASSPLHSSVEEDAAEWPWVTLADVSVGSRPVVFTSDGNYFFSIVGSSVRIYSVASGKVVSTLSSSSIGSSASRVAIGEGHSDVITSAILNPADPFQLLTASLDGDIKIWNFLDAVLLDTIHVGNPISHMCAHEKFKGQVFVAVPTKVKRKMGSVSLGSGNTIIYRVSLKRKQASSVERARPSEVIRVGKTKAAVAMSISPSGSWLVVVAGNKAHVCRTSSTDSGFINFVSPEKLTCLTFHPSEDYFATGDEIGQIRLWYCLDNRLAVSDTTQDRKAQTTTMHWHAHSVSSVAFSRNGSYLLSGGEESVLVIWQIQTGRKEFVPRLGSPISTITVRTNGETEEYLVGLSDGSYLFVDSGSLAVNRTITCIRLDPKGTGRPAHTPVPLAAHRKTSTLILPASHPSSLQMFSPATSALSELEISSTNRVSRRDEKEIEFARVDFVAVSPSGDWMATIDVRDNDEEFSTEVNLKIWRWDSCTWSLNTRVERPHGPKKVVAMSFCPRMAKSEGLLMTVGLDGNVKTWCIRSIVAKGTNIEDFWISRSILSSRSETPTDACWSPDGSVLAASFGRQIALYDSYSNLPLGHLAAMDIRTIESIRFVGRRGRYLIATGRNNAVLWDLVTRTVCWHYYTPCTIAQALAHPDEDLAILIIQPFVEDNALRTSKVLFFGPSSPRPMGIRLLPFRFRAVDWNYDGSNNATRCLIGITQSWNIVACGEESRTTPTMQDVAREIDRTTGVLPRETLFQDIFGRSAFADTPATASSTVAVASDLNSGDRQVSLSLFDVPSYLAPPLESIYSSLIGSFLIKPLEDTGPPLLQDHDESDDMVVDDEPRQVPRQNRVVEDNELDSLVDLFRKHSVDRPHGGHNVNGIANGVHKAHANGVPSSDILLHASTPQLPHIGKKADKTPQKFPAASVAPQPTAPAPITVGNKRKKSIS